VRLLLTLHVLSGCVSIVSDEYSLKIRPMPPVSVYVRMSPGCLEYVSRAPPPFKEAATGGIAQLLVPSAIWPRRTFVTTSASCLTAMPDS